TRRRLSRAGGGERSGSVPCPVRRPGAAWLSPPGCCCSSRADLHDMAEAVQVLERPAGAERDAVQRLLGDGDGEARLFAERKIEIAKERAATGEHHAIVDDVGGEVRGRG